MINKHGIQIIGNDDQPLGLNDVRLSETDEIQSSGLSSIDRFPSLRDAFEEALRNK
jgi:hypothetical protein